eukprot:2584758-Pleurochrysis_carterae.AAC.2
MERGRARETRGERGSEQASEGGRERARGEQGREVGSGTRFTVSKEGSVLKQSKRGQPPEVTIKATTRGPEAALLGKERS